MEFYFALYGKSDTTEPEKRVLGCFFLECLNEFIHNNNRTHELQQEIIKLLEADLGIHKTELEYWASSGIDNQQDSWPISKYILKWKSI